MRKKRVVIYLDEEQREGLEWHSKWTSVSEIGRRAIKEFLARRIGDRNRDYNPNKPPGRKHHWIAAPQGIVEPREDGNYFERKIT